jgi:dihydrofolate synthase/folylpolyglutamate synthase
VIKKNVPAVVETNKKEVLDVIKTICKQRKSEFLPISEIWEWGVKKKTLQASTFFLNSDSKNHKHLKISLPGEHQVNNAVTAIAAIEELRKKGWKISDRAIREGLKKVSWRARFETFRKRPLVILDVAHNPEGIRTLVKTIDELIPEKKLVFIFGVMRDKDYQLMLKQLSKRAELILLTRPDYHRSASTRELEKVLRKLNQRYQVIEKIKDAYSYALKMTASNNAICITGSHFTAGEFLASVKNHRRKLR